MCIWSKTPHLMANRVNYDQYIIVLYYVFYKFQVFNAEQFKQK